MHELQHLGLSYYESKAIDNLLAKKLTPKALAKSTGIPPGKVYSIIKSLRAKGLIEETETRPKQLYIADPQKTVTSLIEQRQHADELLFSILRSKALDAAKARSQPSRFFQLGTTAKDNEEMQLRTFFEAKREVCQIINIHHKPQSNRSAKGKWEDEIRAAIKRGVRFRAIYPENAKLPARLAALSKDRFRVKRLDTDFIRCDIIDGRKVLVKLVHQDALAFGGIIFIEDERFAKNLQRVFEQFWDEAA